MNKALSIDLFFAGLFHLIEAIVVDGSPYRVCIIDTNE